MQLESLGSKEPWCMISLKRRKRGDLKDRSRAPLHSPYKTPDKIEDKVVKAKNQNHLGPKRLSIYLSV